MDLINRERDRLLQQVSRVWGLSFTVLAACCLVVLSGEDATAIGIAAVPFLLLGVAQWRIGVSRSPVWVVAQLVAGATIIAVVTTTGTPTEAVMATITAIAGGSLASLTLVMLSSAPRLIAIAVAFLSITVLTVLLTSTLQAPVRTLGSLVLGWILPAFVGAWVSAAVPQVAKRIASIGRAHRAERNASELEAQRRQSARLLHDTVLATLTLLAHSGVGVSADALREQAAGDAKLLRQLRLGSTPTPKAVGDYNLQPVEETPLGTTLESVKSRFGRMGLEVSWHGTGQVLLPSHILDAFLLALAECLENVRRHSGVTQAHVTITEDETTLRAMVTDQGVGFDIADVGEAKLGFAESVVARLRDVGGNARLFSAPGAGTTVVLEVPR